MNIEIANRLVRLRKEKGLSQEELAAKIGISRQAVSKWERAEASRIPTPDSACPAFMRQPGRPPCYRG
jgi:transcriptional regulator with XRE-family HTH domain